MWGCDAFRLTVRPSSGSRSCFTDASYVLLVKQLVLPEDGVTIVEMRRSLTLNKFMHVAGLWVVMYTIIQCFSNVSLWRNHESNCPYPEEPLPIKTKTKTKTNCIKRQSAHGDYSSTSSCRTKSLAMFSGISVIFCGVSNSYVSIAPFLAEPLTMFCGMLFEKHCLRWRNSRVYRSSM